MARGLGAGKQVTDALKLDVTGGEQDCNLTLWKFMTDLKIVDVAQPDVCYLGGINRTMKVAKMAKAAGLPSGNINAPVDSRRGKGFGAGASTVKRSAPDPDQPPTIANRLMAFSWAWRASNVVADPVSAAR